MPTHLLFSATPEINIDLTIVGAEMAVSWINKYIDHNQPLLMNPQGIAIFKQTVTEICKNTLKIQLKLLDNDGKEI